MRVEGSFSVDLLSGVAS
jgi:hypothetical protein